MNQKKHVTQKPLFAIAWFAMVMVLFMLVAFPLQMRFGMMGLAMTQAVILITALLPVFISRQKIRDIFPVKFSGVGHLLRQTVGTILMWVGTYILVMAVSFILMVLFPNAFLNVSESLGDFFYSVPLALGFVIVAILPAVCEEALHRGYILSAMKDIKNESWIILIMAFLFGVFHLDPVRFLPTAMIGATATYIMLKTKNILMPILMHFINNTTSFLVGALNLPADQASETSSASAEAVENLGGLAVGTVITFTFLVPFLIIGGAALLRPKIDKNKDPKKFGVWKKKRIKTVVFSGLIAAALLMTGFIIMVVSFMMSPPFMMNKEVKMTQADDPEEVIFVAGQTRTYAMDYEFKADKGQIQVVITDEHGEVYFDVVANEIFGNGNLALDAGEYTISIQLVPQDTEAFLEEFGYGSGDFEEGLMPIMPEHEGELVNVHIKMSII